MRSFGLTSAHGSPSREGSSGADAGTPLLLLVVQPGSAGARRPRSWWCLEAARRAVRRVRCLDHRRARRHDPWCSTGKRARRRLEPARIGLGLGGFPLPATTLSTTRGGFATGDPGVSPDRTRTGRPPRTCRSLCHVELFLFMAPSSLGAPALAEARGGRLLRAARTRRTTRRDPKERPRFGDAVAGGT
jgi:hypothetical protein